MTQGPLIHEGAVKKAEEHISDAVKQGGSVLVGGNRMQNLGPNFFQPTVIRNMKSGMQLAHEE